MRWFRYLIVILCLFLIGYFWTIFSIRDNNEVFKGKTEINYPMEKIIPQFRNLQLFTQWNEYFQINKDLKIDYFLPHEGKGSSISFSENKNNIKGDLMIKEEKDQFIRYYIFEKNNTQPHILDLRFSGKNKKTNISWTLKNSKQEAEEPFFGYESEEGFYKFIDKSTDNLKYILAHRIDKEEQLKNIKFDTIFTENFSSELTLGVSTLSKSGLLFKNIIKDYNKVYNFMKTDLQKKEEQIDFLILINSTQNPKAKESSYFLGVPISKKENFSDNNFNYKNLPSSKSYTIFYKGLYQNRLSAVQKIKYLAKKNNETEEMLIQTFISPPEDEKKPLIMKFTLLVKPPTPTPPPPQVPIIK